MHTQLAFSPDGFGLQFRKFTESYFFNISKGVNELPARVGVTDFESGTAFWFFYFGILLIPIGLLVHSFERKNKILPHSFTISYLIVVLVGCYMIPLSGMTFFMLPHAVFMAIQNFIRSKKIK
jgi:hypothetical protein